MKHFILFVICVLIVPLFPMTSTRSVVNAESNVPTPTNELPINTPTQIPTIAVTEAHATVTETLIPVHTVTITPTQTAFATNIDATQTATNSMNTPNGAEPAQSQPSTVDSKSGGSEPVIFVPGIMGSYLDFKGTDGKVCNIWPTKNNTGSKECKELYGLSFVECSNSDNGCKRAVMLRSIDDPRVYATDALREQFGGWNNVYDSFLDTLSTSGFPESTTGRNKTSLERCEDIKTKVLDKELRRDQTLLYAFGYDWRQSTATNAATLSLFIDCVRQTHGNSKVSLVGHSMGGLVIKQLLLNHKNSNSVARVSTFNTPYLGATVALSIFGTGIYKGISYAFAGFSNPLITPNDLKRLAPRIPGAIGLLPSSLYLNQYPCRLVINGNETCTIAQYWQRVKSAFGNQATQHQLSPAVGRDDTGTILQQTKHIDYLIQYSSNKNTTIAKVKNNGSTWTNEMGFGDGTVNEFSLTRQLGGINYNPQTTSNRKVYIFGYCDKKIDHMGIVNHNDAVIRLIMFLRSDPALATIKQNTCINGNSSNITPPPPPKPPATRTPTPSRTNTIRPITGVVNAIHRSEDGSSDEGPELGFTVNYYGQTYDYIYVNNNGNVSFNEPVYSYQSDAIRTNSYAMIAGFFADVDTRNSATKTVQYGQSVVNGRKAFIANYWDVGYNNRKADKLNRFQIVLIDRSNTGAGNFDIEFNYNRIVWETGDANGGTNGFGGQSARVGFASGQGGASFFELPGSGVPGRFLDRNTTVGLVNTSRGSGGIRGRFVVTVRSGIAVMSSRP